MALDLHTPTRLSDANTNNLRGSLLTAVLGANRRKFAYYLVSATRR